MKKRTTETLDNNQVIELQKLKGKRREDFVANIKRPVGRPKKIDEIEDTNQYPAPYKGGAPYSAQDLELYYDFRNVPMPPLPKPLTAEEISKFD